MWSVSKKWSLDVMIEIVVEKYDPKKDFMMDEQPNARKISEGGLKGYYI